MRRLATVAVLLSLLATPQLVAPPVAHASHATVREHDTLRVIDQLTVSRLTITTTAGMTARGQLIRVPSGTFGIAPLSARDTMAGVETNQSLALRARENGAVMGINGGYWLSRPTGVPNGLHVENGRMTAAHAAFRSGDRIQRATVGFHSDGRLVFDRLRTTITLSTGMGDTLVDELNRQVRTDQDGTRPVTGELLLFDDAYGPAIAVPANSTVVTLGELSLTPGGAVSVPVTGVSVTATETNVRVAAGGGVLLAWGTKAPELAHLGAGMPVTFTTTIEGLNGTGDFSGVNHAVAGGPHLIANGQARSLTSWREEGFSDSHLTGRSPRTAIAHTSDGTVLLVTVDGRQAGWSAGVTLRELTDVLLALGARDAVNLDGGGSTVMTQNATVINRPSETRRSVANGLFIYAPLPNPARGTSRACGSQLAASPFFDIQSSVHVQAITCLSQYAITRGVTDTEFVPNGVVTRAQMASFLATFIDQMAARGGRALPATSTSVFGDVPASSVHKANIERLARAGIVNGKTATTFQPGEPVTRAQTARMLAETLVYVSNRPLPAHRDTFSDDATSVHEDAINRLNGVGVISGVGGFAFNPHAGVTRGAMASFLMRATDYLMEQGAVS